MAKNWWMKLDKGTWRSDPRLSRSSTGTRGFWIDLIIVLDDEHVDRMTGTVEHFARACRCLEREASSALQELRDLGIADVSQEGDMWTVVCRRLTRELEISCLRSEAAHAKHANAMQNDCKRDANEVQTPVQTSSSSSNSSSLPERVVQEGIGKEQTEIIYRAYPRHVGKNGAMKAIRSAVAHLGTGKDVPRLDPPDALLYLRSRAETFARSPAGNAGRFTPHPATWFNDHRYLDDDNDWQQGGSNASNRGNHTSRAEQQVAELAKAGVTYQADVPEDGFREDGRFTWGGDGRGSPPVVLEGTR